MHWPQIIYLGVNLFALGIVAAKHGQSAGTYNVWAAIAAWSISLTCLYFGGFFA